MTGPRISLTIDRVVTSGPRLRRADLAAALQREIGSLVAERGVGALGAGRCLEAARVHMPRAGGGEVRRVARATVKAIES